MPPKKTPKPKTPATSEPKPRRKPAAKPRKPAGLSILMVAPEAHPFAKTGGLAEVVGALPLALARLGHRVTLVLPRSRGTDISGEAARPTTLNFGVRTQQLSLITQPIAEGGTAGA